MPRYIIERETGSLTTEQIEAAGRKSNDVLSAMNDVVWIRSYVSDAAGKIYCEYEAPDEEAVRRHAELAGLPVDKISEVAMEISPSMFV